MKRRRFALVVRTALILGAVAAGSGCISSRAYFADRWADAKDIFTASVGTGAGANLRVGPVGTGLFANSDFAGLRGGEGYYLWEDAGTRVGDMLGRHMTCSLSLLAFWGDDFSIAECEPRKKSHNTGGFLVPFSYRKVPASFYTQCEAAAGLGWTLRLGFNPGELLDFLLGWTTLDIYGDDLQARKEREEAENTAKEPPAPPARKEPGATP
jgi:hypothetical protein